MLRNPLFLVGVGFLVLLLIGALGLRLSVRNRWEGDVERHEEEVERYAPAYCAAVKALAAAPRYAGPHPDADAAPVLNTLVRWESTRDGGVPVPAGTFVVPEALRAALRDAGAGYLTASLDEQGLDTAFLSSLHAYGYWDLTGPGSPLVPASTWSLADAPLPRFDDLINASKVHLRRGAADGGAGYDAAARDVRQLAWLVHSTETLLGSAVAQALWNIEADAAARLDGGTSLAAGVDAARRRERQVVLSAPAFYGPFASDETYALVSGCDAVLKCSGLAEASGWTGAFGDWLDEPWRGRVHRLAQVSPADAGCRSGLIAHWRAHPLVPSTGALPGWLSGDVGGILLSVSAGTGSLEGAFGGDGGAPPP